jgi:hypothetical protein
LQFHYWVLHLPKLQLSLAESAPRLAQPLILQERNSLALEAAESLSGIKV